MIANFQSHFAIESTTQMVTPYMVSENLPDITFVPNRLDHMHTYDEIHQPSLSSQRGSIAIHPERYMINHSNSQYPSQLEQRVVPPESEYYNTSDTSHDLDRYGLQHTDTSCGSSTVDITDMTSSARSVMSSSCRDSGVTSPGSTVMSQEDVVMSLHDIKTRGTYDVSMKLLNDTELVENELYMS